MLEKIDRDLRLAALKAERARRSSGECAAASSAADRAGSWVQRTSDLLDEACVW